MRMRIRPDKIIHEDFINNIKSNSDHLSEAMEELMADMVLANCPDYLRLNDLTGMIQAIKEGCLSGIASQFSKALSVEDRNILNDALRGSFSFGYPWAADVLNIDLFQVPDFFTGKFAEVDYKRIYLRYVPRNMDVVLPRKFLESVDAVSNVQELRITSSVSSYSPVLLEVEEGITRLNTHFAITADYAPYCYIKLPDSLQYLDNVIYPTSTGSRVHFIFKPILLKKRYGDEGVSSFEVEDGLIKELSEGSDVRFYGLL